MTGEDCRYDSGVTDTSKTAGPYSHLLDNSLSQRTDALALQLETDARDCSPGGAYRADGALGNTGSYTNLTYELKGMIAGAHGLLVGRTWTAA